MLDDVLFATNFFVILLSENKDNPVIYEIIHLRLFKKAPKYIDCIIADTPESNY